MALYFRQLLAGRDFAATDPVAAQMVNFVYAVGDDATGEAVLVDPAYAVDDLLGIVEGDGMRVVGVLVTHHHFDHVGGEVAGHHVQGIAELLSRRSVPVHAHRAEVGRILAATEMSAGDIVSHEGGDTVAVGAREVRLLHTPGHTQGSQCFLVDDLLISGDTLFLEGCGRMDLDDSDSRAMYASLRTLASLPDTTAVLPGHRYSSSATATMAAVREINVVYKPATEEAWLAAFAR